MENIITVVFKYKEGEAWDNFFKTQIADRIACANAGADIKVTTWYAERDCVSEIKEIEDRE